MCMGNAAGSFRAPVCPGSYPDQECKKCGNNRDENTSAFRASGSEEKPFTRRGRRVRKRCVCVCVCE